MVSDATLAMNEAAERNHGPLTGIPQMLAVMGPVRGRALTSLPFPFPSSRFHVSLGCCWTPLRLFLEPFTPLQGSPVLLSLCLRSSIPDITGKTLCLAETCQTVVLILTDSQGSQSEVALQTLHSLLPHTSHIRLSCLCPCMMMDLCSSR